MPTNLSTPPATEHSMPLATEHSATQHPQQNSQHPQPQNNQQSFDVPDIYAEQIHLRKEWEEKWKC